MRTARGGRRFFGFGASASSIASILGASLRLHWDANNGVALSGTDVTSWTDQAQGIVLTAASASNYAFYSAASAQLNNKPVVEALLSRPTTLRISGLASSVVAANTELYVAIAGRYSAGGITGNDTFFEMKASSTVQMLELYGSSTNQLAYMDPAAAAGFTITPSPANAPDTTKHLVEFAVTASGTTLSEDGTTIGSDANTAGIESAIERISFGARYGTTQGIFFAAGDIVVASNPSAEQKTATKNFLATKYAITVS